LSNYKLFGDGLYLEKLGMEHHFKSMSRGVLDTRDMLYFLSVTAFFILLTQLNLHKK
jgi:ABC-2 type transport system permease protein